VSAEELASKYISSAEKVFKRIEVSKKLLYVDVENIEKVVDCARTYLEDARYYGKKKKFEVSLTCVAYCEGLLDALKVLGVVSFEWPKKGKKIREAE
jgi:FAD synthetase